MIRAGFYQFKPIFGNVAKNRKKVLKTLSDVEADLIVLPELAFTGYNFAEIAELAAVAEDLQNSPTLWELSELCARKDMYIVSGFAEKSGDRFYNSAVLVGPQGLIHTYRKLHLFDREKLFFAPGNNQLQVHNVKGVHVGMMICFDWIFPEVMRSLALAGADLICHPSNLVMSYCQQAMLTRCIENNVYAITANRFGKENQPHGSLNFTGKSQIVAPRGELIYRAPVRREEIHISEIDPAIARNKRLTERNELFSDRRPEYYRKICQ